MLTSASHPLDRCSVALRRGVERKVMRLVLRECLRHADLLSVLEKDDGARADVLGSKVEPHGYCVAHVVPAQPCSVLAFADEHLRRKVRADDESEVDGRWESLQQSLLDVCRKFNFFILVIFNFLMSVVEAVRVESAVSFTRRTGRIRFQNERVMFVENKISSGHLDVRK